MECLKSLVGIDKICDPVAGKFINILQGISIENVSAGVTQEYTDAQDLITTMLDLACDEIEQDFRTAILPKQTYSSVLDTDTVGIYAQNLLSSAADSGTTLRGIRIRLRGYRYTNFILSEVSLKVNNSAAGNILVYDLMTGTLLDTFPLTTVADTPGKVITNTEYERNGQDLDLFITATGTFTQTYDANLYSRGCNLCYEYGNRYALFNNSQINVGDAVIGNNMRGITHSGGLSLNYSVNCDVKPMICNMAPLLVMPVLYKGAEMVLRELKAPNKRLNSIVTVHYDDLGDLIEYYTEKYEQSLNQITDNMKLNDDECFRCHQAIRQMVQIP